MITITMLENIMTILNVIIVLLFIICIFFFVLLVKITDLQNCIRDILYEKNNKNKKEDNPKDDIIYF